MLGDHIRALKNGTWVHAIDLGDQRVLHLQERPGLAPGDRLVRVYKPDFTAGAERVELVVHRERTYQPRAVVARAWSRFMDPSVLAAFTDSEQFAAWCKIGRLPEPAAAEEEAPAATPAKAAAKRAAPAPAAKKAPAAAKPAAAKPAAPKPAARKAAPKKAAEGPAKKSAAKAKPARKAAKKAPARKAAAKKPSAKRVAPAKKAAARATPRKKAAVKKGPAKKRR